MYRKCFCSPIVRIRNRCVAFVTGIVACALLVHFAVAQDASESAKERFESELAQCRKLVEECTEIRVRFLDGSHANSFQWKDKWTEAAKKLAEQRVELEAAAIDWFMQNDQPDEELLQLAGSVAQRLYEVGDFEQSYVIFEKVDKFFPRKDATLKRQLALAGIRCNKYERAIELIKSAEGRKSIEELESQLDKNLFILSQRLSNAWNRESELRASEAEANDLPQVQFTVGENEIVIELFEDQAPETVANFINLVESGFYEETLMAPIVKDLAVQVGVFRKSASEVPVDYTIANEATLPEARKHFVGSVSMFSNNTTDASANVFTITLVPNPDLDFDSEDDDVCQTVFGRVVKGMPFIHALPPTVEIDEETNERKDVKGKVDPTIIDAATVIRKRDHDYDFKKTQITKQ